MSRYINFQAIIWTVIGFILLVNPVVLFAPVKFNVLDTNPNEDVLSHNKNAIAWADSIYLQMSDEERIGQLFMIRAHSNLGESHINEVKEQIEKYHVGGLCFFQGTPERQAELTNQYQDLTSRVPLMIAIDGEWGLGMRFKEDVIHYPRNLMLGAIDDNNLIYQYASSIGRQLKRIGVHINFGPVVDVNNNPNNPVINDRSFGENKYNVVTKSYMYMIGLQDEGIMACAKHFPGHGDTQVDSHYDLPVIGHSIERLEEIELFPFQLLSDNGLQSMMVAHVHMPALDATPNMPTTLSPAVVDTLLKQKMKFKGLIFTDALEMKGVTKHFEVGDIEKRAFLAGNDVLLLPNDIGIAFDSLMTALKTNPLMRPRLEESVKKILTAKFKMGLHTPPCVETTNLVEDINQREDYAIKEELISNALTLLHDHENVVPIESPQDLKIATLSIGSSGWTPFQNTVSFYSSADHYNLEMTFNDAQASATLLALEDYDQVLIALYPPSKLSKNKFGISTKAIQLINTLRDRKNTIFSLFGNPYSLQFFAPQNGPVIMAYEWDRLTEMICAQSIFGAKSLGGKLPVTAGKGYEYIKGQSSKILDRIRFAEPESVGVQSAKLAKLDTIMTEMIDIEASPGGQVFAMRDGAVILHKSYGNTTYKDGNKVTPEHIYDLASITKVAATTLSIMKLYEDGLLDLDQSLSYYVHFLKGTDKENVTIREILAHRSGLYPWIPFYRKTILSANAKSVNLDPAIYSDTFQPGYLQVANNLYMSPHYQEQMWSEIASSNYKPEKDYVYSDLGFIMFAQMIKEITGLSLDEYVEKHFYQPMGLTRMLFNPLKRYSKKRIAPTEQDDYFRSQLLTGHVHDMGAAMLGGVSGHAGLYSNAADLGKLMFMLINKGTFNGRQYLKEETIDLFTTRYNGDTRRGLGFDMQQINMKKSRNMTGLASSSTFGHLGFTGTSTWADPECGIVFVFLSNRVHPDMDNNKLSKYQYRLRTHYTVYSSIE